jgi:tRNA(Arg) A34 adenosine deaminase TadA
MEAGEGGPFGAVVVKDGQIIGEGWNRVTSSCDPTAHAEVAAIREACRELGSFSLAGCVIYSSCEPCPMCLAAIYWARLDRLIYAASRTDAAAGGFDDAFIYDQIPLAPEARNLQSEQILQSEAQNVFRKWSDKSDRTMY